VSPGQILVALTRDSLAARPRGSFAKKKKTQIPTRGRQVLIDHVSDFTVQEKRGWTGPKDRRDRQGDTQPKRRHLKDPGGEDNIMDKVTKGRGGKNEAEAGGYASRGIDYARLYLKGLKRQTHNTTPNKKGKT